MKVCFISNYFNHHQRPLSDAMDRLLEGEYRFIETMPMTQERKNMGWGIDANPSYVLPPAQNALQKQERAALLEEADAVIIGSAPDFLLNSRHRKKLLTIRYSERACKEPWPKWQIPLRYVRNYLRLGRHKNEYLLCASAFTAGDFSLTKTFQGKAYKWGYFPETRRYENIDTLIKKKKPVSILWVGRFIGWKHPETAIHVAGKLKSRGYRFSLEIVGTGELEECLRQKIREEGLCDCVHMLGAMSPEQVRKKMEETQIFLFTSDRNEGWGAVLNEAMNSGCAVVASHAIGSVPFLLKHEENGLVYLDGDQENLDKEVIRLMEDSVFRKKLGRNAYTTITETWNAEMAAQRLVHFLQEIETKGACELFADGPCSKAECLKDDWFYPRKEKDL